MFRILRWIPSILVCAIIVASCGDDSDDEITLLSQDDIHADSDQRATDLVSLVNDRMALYVVELGEDCVRALNRAVVLDYDDRHHRPAGASDNFTATAAAAVIASHCESDQNGQFLPDLYAGYGGAIGFEVYREVPAAMLEDLYIDELEEQDLRTIVFETNLADYQSRTGIVVVPGQ